MSRDILVMLVLISVTHETLGILGRLPTAPCRTNDGLPGFCGLLVQCATFFADLARLSRSPCAMTPYQSGVCCPTDRAVARDPGTMVTAPHPLPVASPAMSNNDINSGCLKGMEMQKQKDDFENFLTSNNIVAGRDSLARQHARLFHTTSDVRRKGRAAALVLDVSRTLSNDLRLSPAQATFSLPRFSVRDTVIGDVCPRQTVCSQPSKYRSMDGSCNNPAHSDWGQAGTSFVRLLPPVYNDGVSSLRQAVSGGPLPRARSLSADTAIDTDSVYDDFTLFVMQWGQFLDHDITHTPISKGSNNSVISCCVNGNIRPPRELHPECLPIEIPTTDTFYSRFGQRCMNFVRSMPAMSRQCTFGPRQQMNQITAYIDGSNVYGSSDEDARELRHLSGGLLKTTRRGQRSLLPPNDEDEQCDSPAQDRPCFAAGDSRVNEQPNLAVLHTVWMRQHNLIATRLAELNPIWSDEILFQEARRIVGAQMQHITYNEYLPIVLGRHFVETFRLVPEKEGYARTYDPSIDASISNAFASAAFRYGHTLIDSNVQGYSRFGTKEIGMKLRRVQFSPFFLYDAGAHDALIRGLAIQPSQKFDNFFSQELTNHLFARNNSFGMDLVALNLQRGRDHGLPSYTDFRTYCNLPPITHFSQLGDVMDLQASQYLSVLYHDVEDIDLFIGGILEFPVAGALVGHTFLCILGDQFYRLKAGDRFFYENGGHHMSFSHPQLQELRKISLARVLCDTSDGLDVMQPLAFLHGKFTNKRTSCDLEVIPKMDLSPWKQ